MYKYFIRKSEKNGDVSYTPMIHYRKEWYNLIKRDGRYLVSTNKRILYNNVRDAYKFIAGHRINSEHKSGKDRYRCLFFIEGVTYVPIIGILYFLLKFFHVKKLDYMFSNKIIALISLSMQIMSVLILILILLL